MRGRRTRHPQTSRTLVASQRGPIGLLFLTRGVYVLHVRAVKQLRWPPSAAAAPGEELRLRCVADRRPGSCTGLLPRAPLLKIIFFVKKKLQQRLMSRNGTADKQQSALCGVPSRGSFNCAISEPLRSPWSHPA